MEISTQRFPRGYQPHAVFDPINEVLLERFTLATAALISPIQKELLITFVTVRILRQALPKVSQTFDLTAGKSATTSGRK